MPLALACACDRSAPPDSGTEPPTAAVKPSPEAAAPEAAEPAPVLPDAEGILARAAESMGGRATLDGVQSFYYKGTIELTGQNIRGDLQIWWKQGDFYMEQIVPGVGEMRAGKQGNEIWSDDPIHGRRLLSGVEAEQHAWASSILLAADWKRYFDSARTIAERTLDGRAIHDVRLQSASGLEVTMSFDAETGLQVGQSLVQESPMGKHPFSVRFEDYRDVGGIKIAFRQVIDAKVQQIVQEIGEVKLNVEVDDSRFAFPRKGGDIVRQPAAPAAAGQG